MKQRVIFKYQVSAGHNVVEMPYGARIVHFDMQHSSPTIWAEVYPDISTLVRRQIIVVGTGHYFDEEFDLHVGTTQDGPFVWHCRTRRVDWTELV